MNVCDDKITKLKERIKSELPVYSSEQINRSREVTLECVLKLGPHSTPKAQIDTAQVFNSPLKEGALRRVFKDQTERAILKSKQVSNMRLRAGKIAGDMGKKRVSVFDRRQDEEICVKKIEDDNKFENENRCEKNLEMRKIVDKKNNEIRRHVGGDISDDRVTSDVIHKVRQRV